MLCDSCQTIVRQLPYDCATVAIQSCDSCHTIEWLLPNARKAICEKLKKNVCLSVEERLSCRLVSPKMSRCLQHATQDIARMTPPSRLSRDVIIARPLLTGSTQKKLVTGPCREDKPPTRDRVLYCGADSRSATGWCHLGDWLIVHFNYSTSSYSASSI